MISEFELEAATVKFDKLARTWPLAVEVDGALIRYIFSTENTTRTSFGALNKFLEENRLDAVVAYAAMYCEEKHKASMTATSDDEEYTPKVKRKYNRKSVKGEE